ncbi:MAG: DNA cytosine methyltransferase [Vicinamibacterales bacterium]
MIVDLFAGGGGASTGIEAALGRPVDVAINHDPTAMAVHRANHLATIHLDADIWEVQPLEATQGRPVDLLWASPDCTHFSVAKGGVPVSQNIRSLAWVVVRWAKAVAPAVICLENVAEFRGWGPLGPDGRPDRVRKGETFRRWRRALERLGYVVDYRILDASLYGAPTKRRRLFLVARRDGRPIVWPEPTHGPGKRPVRTAAECIDWSLPCPSIFERKRPLAAKTLWRIAEGIRRFVLESPHPFLVPMNSSNPPMSVEAPLGTITSQHNRFQVVAPTLVQAGYGERRGQRARTLDLGEPLGTVVAGGQKHALVAAFLAKHYGQRAGGFAGGQQIDLPMGTVTTQDHHALAAATLIKFRGNAGQPPAQPLTEPAPTLTAGGTHLAEVRAFLTAFYGEDGTKGKGQPVTDPLRTVTTKHRLGLVTVEGTDYQIVDIGMRMLEPHELLAAQFGRFAAAYDLTAATTKAAKVRLIGNSVCPEVAEALVRANVSRAARSERAA